MRRRWPRRSACRPKTLPAPTGHLRLSRSRSSKETEIVRRRDFLEWPFFTPAHRDLAERVDTWAARRFAVGQASADGGQHRLEDRDSVDAVCRQLVRDL